MNKKVSIIVPCYNGLKYLPACLDSILSQTYNNIELVFINDGSTEPVREMVDSYQSRFQKRGYELVYLEQENQGQAAAVNLGLLHYTGSYMMWTDSDDILLPDNVMKKVRFLHDNPEYGFVLSEGFIVPADNPDMIIGTVKRVPPKGKDTLFRDLIFEHNVVYGPGVSMVRREAFERTFPARQIINSSAGQNMQLMIPLAFYNKCGYIQEPLFKYVKHPDSHFSRIQGAYKWIDRHEVFKKLIINIIESLDFGRSQDYSEADKDKFIRQVSIHRTDQQMKLALKTKDIRIILRVWNRYKGIEKIKCCLRYLERSGPGKGFRN